MIITDISVHNILKITCTETTQKRIKTSTPQTNKPKSPVPFQELNDVQLGLLRMFSRPMSHEESLDLRRAIVNHLSAKMLSEVDKIVVEKSITQKD